MASAQVVETSVTNNSPSQDFYHPDDLFQSKLIFIVWAGGICVKWYGQSVSILVVKVIFEILRKLCSNTVMNIPSFIA